MNYSLNDDAGKTLHGNEKNVGADTGVCPYTIYLHNLPSEGSQGDMGELEVLFAEGDANNGDIEQASEEHVREPNPNTADEEPENVHCGVQTAAGGLLLHLRAKGPQSQESELQRLQTEGDSDDGDHHCHAGHEILNGDFNAAKHKPNNIA